MIYQETWAVDIALIEQYFLTREGAEALGGGEYCCSSCRIRLKPVPEKELGPIRIPRTYVEIKGNKEEAESLHRRFFLQFVSAGG